MNDYDVNNDNIVNDNGTDHDVPVHVPTRGLRMFNSPEEYAAATHTPLAEAIEMQRQGCLLARAYVIETGELVMPEDDSDAEVIEDAEDSEDSDTD